MVSTPHHQPSDAFIAHDVKGINERPAPVHVPLRFKVASEVLLLDNVGQIINGGRVNADEPSFADLAVPKDYLRVLYLANGQDLRLYVSADSETVAGGVAYPSAHKAITLAMPEPFSLMHELGHLLGVPHPEDGGLGADHFCLESGPSISANTTVWLRQRAGGIVERRPCPQGRPGGPCWGGRPRRRTSRRGAWGGP